MGGMLCTCYTVPCLACTSSVPASTLPVCFGEDWTPGFSRASCFFLRCREPVEAMEIRVRVKADDVRAESDRVTAAFKDWVDAGEHTWEAA